MISLLNVLTIKGVWLARSHFFSIGAFFSRVTLTVSLNKLGEILRKCLNFDKCSSRF